MEATANATLLRFDAPGPGSWDLETVHFPRPMTRYWAETHPPAFRRGVQDFTRYYGMLIDRLEMAYVNGFGYKTVVPVQPEEVPARFARADEVMRGKLWREQLRAWDETVKPASIKMHRALQSVDADALTDAELAAYLRRCAAHHSDMITQHMRHTASAVVPTGDFLAHVGDWTSASPSELLGLLRGTAPVSAGASAELERLIAAILDDAAAQALLDAPEEPGKILDALRALPGETGAAVNGYLELVGYRLLDGFDISEACALEMPDVLLRAIRVAVIGESMEASDVDARVADIRAQVPAEHQAMFDELLGEARLTYRLRDERGVFSDVWASGIMRRAALAAGRRVAARGRLHAAVHMVDATLEEMCALVEGTAGPSADELAARASYRASHKSQDAPPVLGDPPPPMPDPSGLPPGVARLMRATGVALGHLFGSSDAAHDAHSLRGLSASRGTYEGPARRVSGPADFNRIQQGDVLVTESTTEAFNILLPLIGAIVTDAGGLLSHAAIVAREYGIPAVVGTRDATSRIADGARVRVDADSGEVSLLP